MLMIDNLPLPTQTITCVIVAAVKYEVPANILLALAEKEGGTPGVRIKNSNGTYDIGVMQFNTVYLKELARFGITEADVNGSDCYPFDLCAWRIRQHMLHDKADIFTRASNYHSKTPYYNAIYRHDLVQKSAFWQHWIEQHFDTYTVTEAQAAPVRLRTLKTHHPYLQTNSEVI